MKSRDHAHFVDAPLFNGFFADGRFYPYIMGGAPDASGEGSGDTGSSGEGIGESTEGGEGKTGEGEGSNSNTTEGDKVSDEEKKFTQKDVNDLITKEVSKALRGKLDPKEFGYDSAKEVQEALKALKDKEEADKTEQEKALEAAIKEAKEAAKAEVLPQAQEMLVKAQFFINGSEAGISKDALEDAYALAKLHGDWEVSVDENTQQVTGLDKKFFETLKTDKPFLFSSPEGGGAPGSIGAGAGGGTGKKEADREADLRKKYPALGEPVGSSK
jgi:hypothetical protein